MTREMSIFPESNEMRFEPSEVIGGPTSEIVAGALLGALHLALWACVSAGVLAPVSAVLGSG